MKRRARVSRLARHAGCRTVNTPSVKRGDRDRAGPGQSSFSVASDDRALDVSSGIVVRPETRGQGPSVAGERGTASDNDHEVLESDTLLRKRATPRSVLRVAGIFAVRLLKCRVDRPRASTSPSTCLRFRSLDTAQIARAIAILREPIAYRTLGRMSANA